MWLLSSSQNILLKLILPTSLVFLNGCEQVENYTYGLFCGSHFISKVYSELKANYHGMGASMCQNSVI